MRVVLSCVDPDDVETRKKRKLKRRMYHVKVTIALAYSNLVLLTQTYSYHATPLYQGPNEVWHCDGYDKLKPYGFAIHGCIDG